MGMYAMNTSAFKRSFLHAANHLEELHCHFQQTCNEMQQGDIDHIIHSKHAIDRLLLRQIN